MTSSLSHLSQSWRPSGDGLHSVSPTVLLVDDDEHFGAVVTEYLEHEHGYDVYTETSAEAALDRLETTPNISCVVSDYAMPGMDGLELLQEVNERFRNLPFVMFAGQGSERVASRAIQLGADDYLEKDTGETRYELLATRIDNCVTISRQQQKLQDLYAAIEDAGHAMLVTDTDGTITYVNPTMETFSGYTSDELLGETPALLKSGEHDREFYQDLWATILDGEVWEGEVINERKNGEQYVIDQTISPITSDGEITGFVAINRDITAQKTHERELEFFAQAFEQVGTGIAAYDENGTIQYANEAYAAMVGTTPEDLTGRDIATLNPAFEADRFQEYWDSFVVGETRRRESVNRRLDTGETFPVDTVTTHISVDGDEFHVGTIQDIFERKERERALQMYQEAVEQAGHAVVVTDPDGTIEYVNPAFEELTGYGEAEALGETPAILSSCQHDREFYRNLWGTILDGEVWEGEIVNERKDGEEFVIEQTISPIVDDGEITHFVAVNHDITDRREHKRELERQNERLETFGRTVAHDLRNPLSVMEGYLDVAKQADDPSDAHDQIESAIDRMEELIDELLALAEQGQTVLDPSPASLEDVAVTAWGHVDTCRMKLEIADDAQLMMDDGRVVQLFENLFRNAREHAGEEATVRVGLLSDGFYVEDTGPGIPPDKRDAVLKSGFTTSKDGTGFGLAIVTQITDAHDWTVSVTDADGWTDSISEGTGSGARFEFRNVDFA